MANVNFQQELEKMKALVWREVQKYLPQKAPHNHYTMIKDYSSRSS